MNLDLSEEELSQIDHSPLLRFLDSQRSQGHFDSTAEFSISLEAAQRKLGQFSLPRPTAWVLKFVQCANALQCERLDIRLSEKSVAIVFPPGTLDRPDQLLSRLEGMKPESEGESLLFAGLAVLKSLPGRLEISDDRFEHHQEKLSFWDRLRSRLSKTLGILDELQLYAYASPVPLYVDAVSLYDSFDSVALLNGVLTDQAKVRLLVGGSVLTEGDDRKSVFCSWGANRASKYSACVRIEHRPKVIQPNICLDWIRAGVVVKREGQKVRGCGGLLSRTLVSADDLKFDLSGFDFGETEESKARRRRGAFFTWYALRALEKSMTESRWSSYWKEQGEPPFSVLSAAELEAEIHALYEVLTPPSR